MSLRNLFLPALFALSFVLVLFNSNINQIFLSALFMPAIFIFLATLLVSCLVFLLTKNKEKSMLYLSVFVVLFFSYSEILAWSPSAEYSIWLLHFSDRTMALGLELIVLALVFLFINNTTKATSILRFLHIMAIVMIGISLIQIVPFEIRHFSQSSNKNPVVLPTVDPKKISQKPDIFYIVPEDYSSAAVMKQSFNTDISDFYNFLSDKGFYVATQSSSNYPKSFLSIASVLNLSYLDNLSVYKNSSDQDLATPLLNNNVVLNFLRLLGYKYYQMGSWWTPTSNNPNADENFTLESENDLNLDEFAYSIVQSTMLREAFLTGSDADKRRRIIYQFSKLSEVAKIAGPKFVFMHLIAPHGPYVYDSKCNNIDLKTTGKLSEEQNYGNQANCINTKLEQTVTQIQTISPNAVIIIQSDEGAPFLSNKLKTPDNWKTADDALLKEKFPIIAAFYLPKPVTEPNWYPTITSVNSFRIILNSYFSTGLPLLPDRNFIFADLKHLYNFTDVTARIDSHPNRQ